MSLDGRTQYIVNRLNLAAIDEKVCRTHHRDDTKFMMPNVRRDDNANWSLRANLTWCQCRSPHSTADTMELRWFGMLDRRRYQDLSVTLAFAGYDAARLRGRQYQLFYTLASDQARGVRPAQHRRRRDAVSRGDVSR